MNQFTDRAARKERQQCPECGGNTFVHEGETVCADCTRYEPTPERPAARARGRAARSKPIKVDYRYLQAALLPRAQAGDREAVNDLVLSVTPIVATIARRYARRFHLDADDLLQVGLIDVLRAIRMHRAADASFSHFAAVCAGRAIATHSKRTVARRDRMPVVSLNNIPFHPSDPRHGPEVLVMRATMEGALQALPQLDRYIVEQTHALYGGHCKQPSTVGARLGMSPVRAVGAYQRAMSKFAADVRLR